MTHKSLIYFRLDLSLYDNPTDGDDVNRLDHLYLLFSFVISSGRYTRDISEFELLVPHKVDRSGTFLSFHLPHFFHHNFAAHRLKRDFNHHEAVHYKLHFDGSDHVVELLPNHGFISPSFVRETHFKDSGRTLRGRRMDSKPPLMCHYTGQVQGIDGSRAALSTCDGLVSVKCDLSRVTECDID